MSAIWWIRRDIRLSDNPTLAKALQQGDGVIPLFILDPRLNQKEPSQRHAFLFEGLNVLDEQLKQKGSALVVRSGEPGQVLHDLMLQTGATAIYAEEDFTPYATKRDERIAAALPFVRVHGQTVIHPLLVQKSDGKPYTVFTPFSRAWKALLNQDLTSIPTPKQIPSPILPKSDALPQCEGSQLFPSGERVALQRLSLFAESAIFQYNEQRNRVDLDGTSSLSPYLRFGMISLRQAVMAAKQAELRASQLGVSTQGAATWLNELIWREFYISILFHFPYVSKKAFNPKYQNIQWSNNTAEFEAWKVGRTGMPIVDAAMRQLLATGWMHNRARMIVASFLVKDLLINWQWGERWFFETLLDGDPAANNGGWQWTAGTGTDAAPYFRVFNPILQAQKFDPNGDYVRRWVPELADVPASYLQTPWKMPAEIQQKSGCLIGIDYPDLIVDHDEARKRVLRVYKES